MPLLRCFVFAAFILYYNCQLAMPAPSTSDTQESSLVHKDNINLQEAMTTCNNSFEITWDTFQKFNATGILPAQQEEDLTPMCFTRCVFESAQLMTRDGKVIVENTMNQSDKITPELITRCEKAGANEGNSCIKSYKIGSCVWSEVVK